MNKEEKLAVRRMQRYLKEHRREEISLGALSAAACYSPWHSFRLFKAALGLSPSAYLRRIRLSESALLLRDEKLSILEVALRYGYQSVDGYQRSFKKEFGVNPRAYAKNPIPLRLFVPYEVEIPEERKSVMETKNIFISRVDKPERLLLYKSASEGKDDYWDYASEVGCDLWGILLSLKSLGEPVCLYLPKSLQIPGESSYVQGVEEPLDYRGPLPEGFKQRVLPQASFLLFQGESFKEEEYGEAILALKKAMDAYDPKPLGYRKKKEGLRIQLEPKGERGYIELLEVEAL
jgi:AraC-like DNA-binding protein